MKKLIALCALALSFTTCAAEAAKISVIEIDSNIINYSVEAEDASKVVTALYSAGKLYSVNEGEGSKVFYAPPARKSTIKTYEFDKKTGKLLKTEVTDNIQTSSSPYLESLVLFLPEDGLRQAAEHIHSVVGGDMAEIAPEMPVNPALYDTVYVGYTNANGNIASAAEKMFAEYDFGKATIVPFVYGEVNGTDRYISTLEPSALVYDALNVRYAGENDIDSWIEEMETSAYLRY